MLEILPLTPLTAVYAGSAGSSFGGPLASAYPAERVSPAATSAMNRLLISLDPPCCLRTLGCPPEVSDK